MKKTLLFLLGILILGLAVVLGLSFVKSSGRTSGSVARAGEYRSTTTATGFVNYSVLQNAETSGSCTLGSVVITGVAAGTFTIYDATSTVTNALWPTTTLASFPASTATGTYTFDIACQKGILMDFKGTMGTTTTTFR